MWFELKIEHCEPNQVEELSEALENTGALSITLTDKNDDPVLEPEPGTTPLWPEVVIKALFNDEDEAKQSLKIMQTQFPSLTLSVDELVEQDWERVCLDEFKPQHFGNNLWVCPSWHDVPDENAVNLILDPGLAFGTGTHPTTSLCLQYLSDADLADKKVIDFGCGSGILAIAALKLGAKEAQAIDIDDQALIATQDNAGRNGINLNQLKIGKADSLESPVDLLMANILLSPLISLKQNFKALLKSEGSLVVSGLLKEQKAELIEAYQDSFSLKLEKDLDDWSLLVFKPKS
ncbi:MAG: 50S ribosomal protein L11 methyltransferase [Proteobacteria bacterium]|nr:50S ribosomal protein L11 methyltransferase [Pseudomonadota bacterium]